jgi:hypothetical protein
MTRALTALFLVPALAGLLFGALAVVAIPLMLGVATLLALPLFFLFRRYGWLQWWHASTVGVLCGSLVAALYWFSGPRGHIEFAGARNAVFVLGLGLVVGTTYWWAGLFRNKAFPSVPTTLPTSMLVMLPMLIGVAWLYERLEPHPVEGKTVSVLEPSTKMSERSGKVSLRLSNGVVVVASFPLEYESRYPLGTCFHVSERWSLDQSAKVYFVHAPKFGAGNEVSGDC